MTSLDLDLSREARPQQSAPGLRLSPSDWYQGSVALLTVLLFDTGFTDYLFDGRHLSVTPLDWLLLLAALALPIAFWPGHVNEVFRTRLPVWCGVYFTWTCVSYLWSSQTLTVVRELRLRTLVCVMLPLFALIFSSAIAVRVARRAIVACVLLSVALNAYDFLHPRTFSTIFGRSAGMFMNPNVSATAIVTGMVFGLMTVPRRWRAVFVIVAGAGVVLTLSRGLLLCYAVATIYFASTGAFSFRQLITAGATAAMAIATILLLTIGAEKIASAARVIVESNVLERITDPSIALGGADESANVRKAAAQMGWRVFEDHPLIGGGVGATVDWDLTASTHNIYIRDLAEYGIFGIVLFPALLVLIVRGVTGPPRYPLRAFVFVLALTGLFSHNVLDEWDVLLSMALAATIAVNSRVQVPPAETS